MTAFFVVRLVSAKTIGCGFQTRMVLAIAKGTNKFLFSGKDAAQFIC